MINGTAVRRDDPEVANLLMLALGLLFLRIRAASLSLRDVAATLLTPYPRIQDQADGRLPVLVDTALLIEYEVHHG